MPPDQGMELRIAIGCYRFAILETESALDVGGIARALERERAALTVLIRTIAALTSQPFVIPHQTVTYGNGPAVVAASTTIVDPNRITT